jgi:hypothetical protein
MAAINDLIDQVKKEAADAASVVEVAKMVLVDLAKAVNAGLMLLNANGDSPGSTGTTPAPVKRRRFKGTKGKHQYWHGRLSGQYLYPDGKKACSNCHRVVAANSQNFHGAPSTPSRFQSWCRLCTDVSTPKAQARRAVNIDGTPPRRLQGRRGDAKSARVIRTNSLDVAR